MNNEKISLFTSNALREKYKYFMHKSGLSIIYFPKETTTAYAILGVACGSIDTEAGGQSFPDGIAHFLEHKLFTNEDGSDSFERFSELGADANAYTSFNRTAYLFSCTDNFKESLDELLDFVTHPYFTDDSVESEKPIIAEEIKMYDDSPSEACLYGMLEGLYFNNKVKSNICGSVKSIGEITPKHLYDFYKAFYKPSNAFLIVCGNVKEQDILSAADKYFSEDKKCDFKASAPNTEEPVSVASEYVEKRMPISKPIFSIGFKDSSIPNNANDRYRKDAGMAILNEMLFSRAAPIYSNLYESGLISSPNLDYGYTVSQTFAYNFISGESDSPRCVLEKIKKYIGEAKLLPEDFERGKRVMYAEFVKSFDSTESIANTLLTFAPDGAEIFEYGETIKNISFNEITALFEELRAMPTTLCEVVPLKS